MLNYNTIFNMEEVENRLSKVVYNYCYHDDFFHHGPNPEKSKNKPGKNQSNSLANLKLELMRKTLRLSDKDKPLFSIHKLSHQKN